MMASPGRHLYDSMQGCSGIKSDLSWPKRSHETGLLVWLVDT